MTLLTAFVTLMSRYSHQDDIVLGLPTTGRTLCELEPLIGFFNNPLPLRIHLHGNQSFSDLLNQVRQTGLDAYANQDIPFETLVSELQPEPTLSHHPPLSGHVRLGRVRTRSP